MKPAPTPVGIRVVLGRAYNADDFESFVDDILDHWAYLDCTLSYKIREELMFLWTHAAVYNCYEEEG